MAAAAPIAVRRRRNGEKRAKPNHASSQRKIRSGLIARHSSIVALDVGDVAVEGAVGQHHQPRAVQLAFRLQLEERLLDRLDGEAAVHRVLGEREGVDVERLGAGQHQPVVVRLVAVAVDEDDVARPEQRLVDDLVRRRGAVGDEEAAVAAEGAGGLVLRDLDVAGRLEQAVEAAGGRRRFGEEQVDAVELAHVADPVGLEDRLPAGHRQRVEGADRALGVVLEIVEVRRLVAVLHPVEDRQVDLHRLLDPVEDAPDGRRLVGAGEPGDVAVRREVDVELRTPPAHHLRQEDPEIAALRRLGDLHLTGEDLAQHRHRVLRGVAEAVADHHRLEIRVEHDGEDRVLEAPDHDRLVDELVLDAPQPAEGLPDLRPHRPLGGRDEQDLEVRPPALTAADRGRQDVGDMGLALLVRLPGLLVIPVAVGEERAADPLHQAREARPVPGLQALVHLRHQPGSGIAAELLQRRELGEQRPRVLAGTGPRPPPGAREGLGDAVQRPPAVHPRLRGREELVQGHGPVVRRCRAHSRSLPGALDRAVRGPPGRCPCTVVLVDGSVKAGPARSYSGRTSDLSTSPLRSGPDPS